ncbi:MAG: DUF2857 domain-containing protein [Gammaproteobacteria bacterium]|nr:DUF2857 domain-containing protein [Gammaproteobacteria bacterium]
MNSHHVEFRYQVIRYLVTLVSNGDFEHLQQLGLNATHHAALSRLNCGDLERIAHHIPNHLFQLSINPQQLDRVLCCCQHHQSDRVLVEHLLNAGASAPVLNRLYGLTSADVARLRQQLHIPLVQGRPRVLSDSEQDHVYRLWQTSNQPTLAEKLLHLHQHTTIPIRSIWPYVTDWFLNSNNTF